MVAAGAVAETERLVLLYQHPDHATALLRVFRQPELWRFIDPERWRAMDLARLQLSIERNLATYERYGFCQWPVAEKATGTIIGAAGCYWSDDYAAPELSYHFEPAVWGRGYATEAAQAVLGVVHRLGFTRVVSGVHPENLASQRVLGKLGFHRSGERADGFWLFELTLAA